MRFLSACRGCCGPIALRYVIVVMAATGLGFVFILRNSFSLALTQMRVKENHTKSKTTRDEVCPPAHEGHKELNRDVGEFHWDAMDAQHLISAYFYGYTIAHIPGGILADLVGAKIVLNLGLGLSGVSSLLAPICAKASYWMLFFIRVVMGLGHGVIFPALSSLVAKWSPPLERSLMSAITYSGIMFGSALGISLAGWILGSLPGWEPVFYIFGGAMLVWNLAFQFVGFSSPKDHPYITDREQTKIEELIAGSSRKKPTKIPWVSILTSMPNISFILINVGHSWLVFFVGTQIPIYVKTVLHYNIKGSGISSALPYLTMWISGISIGVLSDWIIKNGKMSVTNTRKTFAILSNVLPVPFLIGASYAGCSKDLATGLFTMMMLFKGFAYPSLKANPLDLSPNFAGVLMGLANGASAAGGLMIPHIVGLFIQKGEASVVVWRNTFFFSAAVLLVLTLPFAFYASGERQKWDSIEEPATTPAPTPAPAPAPAT